MIFSQNGIISQIGDPILLRMWFEGRNRNFIEINTIFLQWFHRVYNNYIACEIKIVPGRVMESISIIPIRDNVLFT